MTDYQQIYDNMVNSVSDYLKENDLKTMVLGISGGIDSTVVAAICRIVSNETHIPLIGVSLPCVTNKGCEISAASVVGREFCNEFKEISLQNLYQSTSAFCKALDGTVTTNIAEGNIKARLRMVALYHIASLRHGIVMDTDNLTESALGFFTIHGDQGDLSPIALLWKHEVYELAKWLQENVYHGSKGLEMSIALEPTDGNGVSESDMEQIAPNMEYNDVDAMLQRFMSIEDPNERRQALLSLESNDECAIAEPYGKETMKRVINRHLGSEFKRWHRPFQVDVYKGGILDGNAMPYKPFQKS